MNEITNVFIGIATFAVAIATFLLWKATKKVAESTEATKEIAKEVGTYNILPRIELKYYQRQEQDGYYQYAVKMINNGKDTAYNVVVETRSNDTGSTEHIPFNLPVFYQVWIGHSVQKNDKIIQFTINFEDVAGNKHTRKFDYEIAKNELDSESITWDLYTPIPDHVKF